MHHHFSQPNFLSRRALAFAGIATLHVFIAYLLLTALAQPAPKTPDTPLAGFFTPTHEPPPPAPTPDYTPERRVGPIEAPPPEVIGPPQNPIRMVAVVPAGPGTGVGDPAIQRPVATRVIGTNQLPNSEDYYPPDLIRQGIQGATGLRVCVDPQGARRADPMIEASSGDTRLDFAAVNLARHGRYARSVQGDSPVANCFRFLISFKLAK